MYLCSIILPDIDRAFAFLCDPCPNQIGCLTYAEKRQTVACFQVASVAIECDAKLNYRPLLVSQWIAD